MAQAPGGGSGALVELRGIRKRFGEVQALRGVDFAVEPGEVRILAGENGAGKTTLMNVLAGLYRADEGEILVRGRRVQIAAPRDALRHGVGMVHQHFELVPPFSVLDNVVLGREGHPLWLRRSRQRRDVRALMDRYGLRVDPDARVRDLSIGLQQKVEILKTLYRGVDLLILDEPTTHLTPQEVDALFGTIRELTRGDGAGTRRLSVVLITHKLREMLSVGDRVTVMRRGEVVGTVPRAEATEAGLVRMLMGGTNPSPTPLRAGEGGGGGVPVPILELRDVTAAGRGERPVVDGCSLAVGTGEIVGVAGVAGNGQKELAEVVVGLRPLVSGELLLRGQPVGGRPVRERLVSGVAYVPEDRIGEGILPHLSLTETLLLGPHHLLFRGRALFDGAAARELARTAIREYGILARDERVAASSLSGGNIQKVLVARAVILAEAVEHGLLIALNPARGLDVMTSELVYRRLRELRDAGKGILLISEDLDELMALCDRVAVIYRGRIVGVFGRGEYDPYKMGELMVGSGGDGRP